MFSLSLCITYVRLLDSQLSSSECKRNIYGQYKSCQNILQNLSSLSKLTVEKNSHVSPYDMKKDIQTDILTFRVAYIVETCL